MVRHSAAVATTNTSQEEVVDALLTASRAMVALAARSLADLDADVTLPQYRALVLLASRGPQRVVDISTELEVDPSAATRMCDRLVRKDLVNRERSDGDRREVYLGLTAAGRALVRKVTQRRRAELELLVERLEQETYAPLVKAMQALGDATGEVPERRLRANLVQRRTTSP